MTVFLTPDGRPFFAGTYFPPSPGTACRRSARCSTRVSDAWRDKRAGRRGAGGRDRRAPAAGAGLSAGRTAAPSPADLDGALSRTLARRVRHRAAAASAAPRSSRRPWTSSCCCATTRAPATGSRSDGGAHAARRWPAAASTTSSAAVSPATPSTREWVVPHFEKMLYDNAQLLGVYAHLYRRCAGDDDASGVSIVGDPALGARRARDHRDGRLPPARAPHRRGRFRLVARRGHRRPRGHLLRVDPRAARRGARRGRRSVGRRASSR